MYLKLNVKENLGNSIEVFHSNISFDRVVSHPVVYLVFNLNNSF